MRVKSLFYILFILTLLSSCLKSTNEGIPKPVRQTLERSGINQPELMKALVNFIKPADSLKEKATYWLVGNMLGNYTVHYIVEDSSKHTYRFPPENYPNYKSLQISWDSIENIVGPLHYQADSFLMDQKTVNSAFLTKNINEAFKAHQNFPWSKNYDFNIFCKWILPYRCANEQLEDFREHFIKKYSPYLVEKDSLSVLEVALILNDLINNELKYKDNYNKEANVQTIKQLEKSKTGNFYDLNIYKIKALRSFGIAATLDYTPYLADTSFGYAWTTVILPDHSEFILEFPQKVHHLGMPGRLAKVYRRTFERDTTSLYAIKKIKEITPPYLGHFFYRDVTNPLGSKSVRLPYYNKTNYAYLAVFNNGDWHPIDWSIPKTALGTLFNKMGTHIVYLPVSLVKKNLHSLGPPFLLSNNGSIKRFTPDFTTEQPAKLKYTGPEQKIISGETYSLYLWNENWSYLFSFTGSHQAFNVPLPDNGLFLLVNSDPVMNERIFSISKDGNQLFY